MEFSEGEGAAWFRLTVFSKGAALHIGRQFASTDSLAPEEFIANGVYEVVSAPAEVRSESEESATDVQVVVRRVPSPQAKLYRRPYDGRNGARLQEHQAGCPRRRFDRFLAITLE